AKTTTLPLGTDERDIYLPRFGFTNASTVWFMQMGRLQNEKLLFTVQLPPAGAVAKLTAQVIYREKSPTYIEVTDDLNFLADGSFVLTNEQSGWNRVLWCSADGKTQRPLTGDYDVLEVKGVDEARKRVLFVASAKTPMQQEVYTV